MANNLNAQQQAVLTAFSKGHNIFITGPAGTGKSFVLRHVINHARSREINIGITASTGLAACHIHGRTIHSFLGIGLASKPAAQLAQKARANKMLVKRLKKLQVLIIDEVSMIDSELLDKVSEVLGLVRERTEKPFGGVQMVLCGDFCQLPPVKGAYCFESETWKTADIKVCSLSILVRQKDDVQLSDILNELRWGTCSRSTLKVLSNLLNTEFPNHIRPTVLYSKNVDVDNINLTELAALKEAGEVSMIYPTTYSAHPMAKHWATSLRIPESVELCVGAQVVVTSNINNQSTVVVNGTRGVVTAVFGDRVSIKMINGIITDISLTSMENEDIMDCKVTFMPLKLAYAITIHKSQGMTLDCVEMDLGDSVFEYGQAYTALSRARTMDSIKITSIKAKSFKTHPRVLEFYKNIATD